MASAHDRLPLGALRVFEAVATHLSFSAAADALNVTPAAVSQQIKTLEGYVQVPLFRRAGRRVEITEEGLEMLPEVRVGLDRLEAALTQAKQRRRSGPLQVSLLVSFLQIWLVPRLRTFRSMYPDVDLRFHTSRELVDFTHSATHCAIRFGRGHWPNLHCEKLMDDWLVPVAHPDLIKQHGLMERGASLANFPLLDSDDEPWSHWRTEDDRLPWRASAPNIDDSAGLVSAAEEGLGYLLGRWTLVSTSLQQGRLQLAAKDVIPYPLAYYFVCPTAFLGTPKVARFREWILQAAREFTPPAHAR